MTISERGYWGVGESFIHPNLSELTETSTKKWHVETLSSSHIEDETDWTVECLAVGKLADVLKRNNLPTTFTIDVASSADKLSVFDNENHAIIHNCYIECNINPNNIDSLRDVANELDKATLLFKIANS